MSIPSRILSAGNSPLATIAIAGDGAAALVATGTNQATALQLSAVMNQITTSSSSTGYQLPPCEAGAVVFVRNDSGQTLTSYPDETSGVTINGSASLTVATAKSILYFAPTNTAWYAILTA